MFSKTKDAGEADKAVHAIRLLASPQGSDDLPTALALLIEVANEGSGLAAHQLAVIAAAGVLRPSSWADALDLLARSADLGFEPAGAQLRLLSGRASDNWGEMAQAVDVAAWLTPPPKHGLCESPRVRAVDGFVAPEVCDWLISRARGRLAPAQTYSEAGEARLEQGRTNSETDFNITETDLVTLLVRARIGAVLAMPTTVMELTKVLHYSPGQRFNRHFDCLDPTIEGHATEIAARGQRIATFLIYLNDDYQGGETEFCHPALRHRGARGDGMFFANVDLAGEPDRQSLHQGLPPTGGEKWLLSQWIRNRPQ